MFGKRFRQGLEVHFKTGMNIVFFEIEDWEKEYLSSKLIGHQLTFFSEPLTQENVHQAKNADVLSVFVYSKVDREMLMRLPGAKLITTRSMGYDHIDIVACRERGVTIARVPNYGDRTVAEHTFGLILGLSRKIFLARERTEKDIFDYHGLQGFDLYEKTIGIIGGGKIGLNVARIAHDGFRMRVMVSDPVPKPELAQEIGFDYVPFDKLLGKADVITLHCPYTPDTHHLLNEKNIAKIKRGAILINTARGALVDTKALLGALDEGVLAGAGLDVLEEECFIKEERELMSKEFPKQCDLGTIIRNHMLAKRDDVIITPHIAFNSREALERILATTIDNINAFTLGTCLNIVN